MNWLLTQIINSTLLHRAFPFIIPYQITTQWEKKSSRGKCFCFVYLKGEVYQDTSDIQRDVSVRMAKLNLSSTAPPELSQVMPMAVNLKKFLQREYL